MDEPAPVRAAPTSRLFGGAVAVTAGSYAVWLGANTAEAVAVDPLLVLGGVAALHGLGLPTRVAAALGRANGPLLAGYAGALFLVLGWREVVEDAPVGGSAGADPGLVALATLLLFSGTVLTARDGLSD